jgi:outer membrane protein assembly factor BamB
VYVTINQHDGGPKDTYALDAQTGSVVWHVGGVGAFVSVTVANGVAYVAPDSIDAFDARTGTPLAVFGSGVRNSPVVANGMVYFTANDGLHAYGITR